MALINFSWIKRFEKQYHEVTAEGEAVEGSCGADSDEPAEKADGEVSGDEGDNDAVKAGAGLDKASYFADKQDDEVTEDEGDSQEAAGVY